MKEEKPHTLPLHQEKQKHPHHSDARINITVHSDDTAIKDHFWQSESAHHFFGDIERQAVDDFKDLDAFLTANGAALKRELSAFFQGKELTDKDLEAFIEGVIKAAEKNKDLESSPRYKALSPELKNQINIFAASYLQNKAYQDRMALYKQLFHLCKIVADQVEQNSNGNDELAYDHAYKLLVLFEGKDLKETISHFEAYRKGLGLVEAAAGSAKIVHDAFAAVNLPADGRLVTLDAWRKLIANRGSKALSLFAMADRIEAKKAEEARGVETAAAEAPKTHLVPESLEEATKLKSELTYKRADEYPAFAELCLQYNVQEKDFDKSLEVNKNRKTRDNLPGAMVDGASVGKSGYWLVKLPIGDPRAFIFGHITNCQSIGGASERCVIDGVTRENNGFYVLLHDSKRGGGDEPSPQPIKQGGAIDYDRYEIVG